MTPQTLTDSWTAYMAAFSATNDAERARLLDQCVSDDVVFTNPGGNGQGRAALDAHIAGFQQKMPGAYFTTDKLHPQPDTLLAVWTLFKSDGAKLATGYNFVRPGPDGRFSYMAGFF